MDAIFAALEALQQPGPERRNKQPVAAPPPARPQPAPPAPAPARVPDPPAEPHPAHERGAGLLQGMFEDGNSLLRAVIAAEILQPPLALRQPRDQAQEEPAHWIQQPNEP